MATNRVMVAEIPEGTSGDWCVERFTVTPEQSRIDALRGMFNGGRYVPAGTYTRLVCRGATIMSDTPDELRDLMALRVWAKAGHVLIAGLGLGCAVQEVLRCDTVECVTVVEKSSDVISLVAAPLIRAYGKRLNIVECDIFAWKPPCGVRYSAAWFDIWDTICGDNLSEMTRLKRRFARRADWKGCWCEYQCKRSR